MKLSDNGEYKQLITRISSIFERGRQQAAQAVNVQLLETYWEIGRYIVEFEQEGAERAKYGENLLVYLSKRFVPFIRERVWTKQPETDETVLSSFSN